MSQGSVLAGRRPVFAGRLAKTWFFVFLPVVAGKNRLKLVITGYKWLKLDMNVYYNFHYLLCILDQFLVYIQGSTFVNWNNTWFYCYFHETVLLVLNNRGRDALLILLATSLMKAGDLRCGQV